MLNFEVYMDWLEEQAGFDPYYYLVSSIQLEGMYVMNAPRIATYGHFGPASLEAYGEGRTSSWWTWNDKTCGGRGNGFAKKDPIHKFQYGAGVREDR